MMHAVDWFPTLLHVAGGTADAGMDGMDMWPTISNNTPSPRKEFVYNIDEILRNAAIRVGDYKLIKGNTGNWNGCYPLPNVKYGLPHAIADDNAEYDPTEHFDVSKKYPEV